MKETKALRLVAPCLLALPFAIARAETSHEAANNPSKALTDVSPFSQRLLQDQNILDPIPQFLPGSAFTSGNQFTSTPPGGDWTFTDGPAVDEKLIAFKRCLAIPGCEIGCVLLAQALKASFKCLPLQN